MSAPYHRAELTRAHDLRVRELPEWGCLLVYTPSRPALHYLDQYAWLVFATCSTPKTYDQLLASFREAVPPDTPVDTVDSTFEDLLRKLIDEDVLVVAAESVATEV